MTIDRKNIFDNKEKYKLYRNVVDLLKPSISKRNISDYKIMLSSTYFPIRVFYPNKLKDMENIIIYIPGDGTITDSLGEYTNICNNLAIKTKSCIIAIDYFDEDITFPKTTNKVEEVVKYLYEELIKINISKEKIYLMGDSFGSIIVNDINIKFIENNIDYIKNNIAFYPLIKLKYENNNISSKDAITITRYKKFINNYLNNNEYKSVLEYKNINKFPRYLVITADIDPLKEEALLFYKKLTNAKHYNLEYNTHGFLKNISTMKNNVYEELNNFIKN